MSTDIKAPTFPESVADGTIATWHKKPGEFASRDELLVDIETDKVVLEVVAPADGTVAEVLKQEGDTVQSEELIGRFEEGEKGKESGEGKNGGDDKKGKEDKESDADSGEAAKSGAEKDSGKGANGDTGAKAKADARDGKAESKDSGEEVKMGPAARKLVEEEDVNASRIEGTGKGGVITKEDVLKHLKQRETGGEGKPAAGEQRSAGQSAGQSAGGVSAATELPAGDSERLEKRVPMTRLRARIAERLLDATRSTAMLTTFNEVNMQPVMDLRNDYKDLFEKTHGVRLGFMGFFVRAACEALKRFPAVNASIDGNDVVYHGYQDIGVAVSTDKGLVVPVLRNAEHMSLAEVESTVRDFGLRARDGKLGLDEIQGGTFTLTNGGVFGSLMSTPILNPPQAGILGMHKIQERPMAVDGQVVIQPMMYLALSYDHRLIDGREAVQFLVAIKEMIEDPARILLEI